MTTAVISSARVSVLNASFEHLGATSMGRAMKLIIRGDAEIEESDPNRLVRHKRGSFPWPKVIRLLRYVKINLAYGPAIWSKQGVLKRDNYTCAYCNKYANTVDHILPVSKGGRNTWENSIASCSPCNTRKRNRTPEEADMPLLFLPTVPMTVSIRSNKPKRRKN